MSSIADRMSSPEGNGDIDPSDLVAQMIVDLASPNGLRRQRARQSLVELGPLAVPALTEAMSHSDWRVRWEVAKALTEIADPSAASALVAAMEDERPGVRWVASEGVIALGHRGLVPLLVALISKADSVWFRLGAHHVLRAMLGRGMDPYVVPVLRALDSAEPSVAVPPAAEDALDLLRQAL